MRAPSITFATLASLALVACGPAAQQGADDPVTGDDVVNIDDLVDADSDATGAIQVGDPALFLGAARSQVDTTNAHLKSALEVVRAVVGGREPDGKGIGKRGFAYAYWDHDVDGKQVRFLVVRINKRRVRYLLAARESGGAWKGLLTGIFIKRAPHVGGGRLHISLTNASDLFGSPNADGSIHLVFANHRDDVRGRRILYLNVKDRSKPDQPAVNYGQDILRFPGVGGRFRGVLVTDILPGDTGPAAGIEAMAMRVFWKHGAGGRADVAIAHVAPRPVKFLGAAHECWDAQGLRTAYADPWPDNDANNPNEGDPSDAASCAGFGKDEPGQDAASPDGQDHDPELDDLLVEAEADTITPDEAGQEEDPSLPDGA
ncbi:MAG: hypothetical protein D6729_16415 [Deltaproteobacteria bacterium]|nr:MAG: hypothetical protein D6729_16415 [Deltaproteobacteria bacterium]